MRRIFFITSIILLFIVTMIIYQCDKDDGSELNLGDTMVQNTTGSTGDIKYNCISPLKDSTKFITFLFN